VKIVVGRRKDKIAVNKANGLLNKRRERSMYGKGGEMPKTEGSYMCQQVVVRISSLHSPGPTMKEKW
jgi:hypothetical protein